MNNNNAYIGLLAVIVGVACVVGLTNNNNRYERTNTSGDRAARKHQPSYEATYRYEVEPVYCKVEKPRVSTQLNWTYSHGKSGFGVSYSYGMPAYRPCYVQKQYCVYPVATTYSYYF